MEIEKARKPKELVIMKFDPESKLTLGLNEDENFDAEEYKDESRVSPSSSKGQLVTKGSLL